MSLKHYHRFDSGRKMYLTRRLVIRQSIWNLHSFCVRLFILVVFLLTIFLILFRLNVFHAPHFFSVRLSPPLHSSLPFFPPTLLPLSSSLPFAFSSVIRFVGVRLPFRIKVPSSSVVAFPCAGRTVLGVVLVMSRRTANGAMRREGIRQSWGRAAPNDVVIRFVIGNMSKIEGKAATKNDALLEEEQKKYGDLIWYDLEDTYGNLHLKMFAAFEWQMHFCPNAEFVMKSDDDTIVDLERWKLWVEKKFRKQAEEKGSAAFFGVVLANTRPFRRIGHKWYVSKKAFPGDRFPNYMQGATYFGTAQAIRAVMAHTAEVIGFNMDDLLYTGILAERVKPPVFRLDSGMFHFRGEQRIRPKNEFCENGVPFLFASFSGIRTRYLNSVKEYKRAYERIHMAKCK